MAMMPGNVSKGRELRAFEDYINKDHTHLDDALALYDNASTNIDAMINFATFVKPQDRQHIRAHWFPESAPQVGDPPKNPYWPTYEPMGKVLQEGLVFALKLCSREMKANGKFGPARDPYLPIDCHWVCAGKSYEVVITLGVDYFDTGAQFDNHVNMLILTPTLPTTRRGEVIAGDLQDENIWMVKHQDLGPAETEVKRNAGKNIITGRLRNKKD